ncbi:uncharacterized protein BXZ73DRAFT_91355 [Epithele typhae]|uniref:uncharacterized protein n=1 Tax=Epithele typhae TaxID=378194 RepID=UPI0020087891|nr:uncharacterized protein BXZ73DRAFT_91355 [Epithele typhae]KAH9923943.1 hypothetical protein BXZ73DRAFT_91355 [Epithele typhae]
MLSATLRKEACRLVKSASLTRPYLRQSSTRRAQLSTSSAVHSSPNASSSSSPAGPASLPWFMDPAEDEAPIASPYMRRSALAQGPPHPPLPVDLPEGHPIARLHAALKVSPHLEPGTLLVRSPIPTAVGPPPTDALPRGRRKRGRTNLGEGVEVHLGGLWEWHVIAQVKEGTEDRGAIESTTRVVRKALLASEPPISLPQKNRRKGHNGWAMIDAGSFAVHIVSQEARERFFPERRDFV